MTRTTSTVAIFSKRYYLYYSYCSCWWHYYGLTYSDTRSPRAVNLPAISFRGKINCGPRKFIISCSNLPPTTAATMLSPLLYPNIAPRNRVSHTDVRRVHRLLLLFSFENLFPSYHGKFNADESNLFDLLQVGLLERTIFYIINWLSYLRFKQTVFKIVMYVWVIKLYSI